LKFKEVISSFIEIRHISIFSYIDVKSITLGGLGITFGCTNAVFSNCIFATDEEAEQAQAVFKLYKS
jgi:hypothetical protein